MHPVFNNELDSFILVMLAHLREMTIKKVDASQNGAHSTFLVAEGDDDERHLYFYYVTLLEGLRGRMMESAFHVTVSRCCSFTNYLQCLSSFIHPFLIVVYFIVFSVDIGVAGCLLKRAVWVDFDSKWNTLAPTISRSKISIGSIERFVAFKF